MFGFISMLRQPHPTGVVCKFWSAASFYITQTLVLITSSLSGTTRPNPKLQVLGRNLPVHIWKAPSIWLQLRLECLKNLLANQHFICNSASYMSPSMFFKSFAFLPWSFFATGGFTSDIFFLVIRISLLQVMRHCAFSLLGYQGVKKKTLNPVQTLAIFDCF